MIIILVWVDENDSRSSSEEPGPKGGGGWLEALGVQSHGITQNPSSSKLRLHPKNFLQIRLKLSVKIGKRWARTYIIIDA